MAILSRPKISPQQRYDLEDLMAMLAAARSDSKLLVKSQLSATNLIMQGFNVSGTGLNSATVNMANAMLIIPQNSFDFSYFVSAPAEPNITVPDADLTDSTRNYLELALSTEDGTPLTKAFWDPEANSGNGAEFNQIVNTVTDLKCSVIVSTGGFSGSPDRIPLAIIDCDGSGIIKIILDRRELFGRLSKPNDLDFDFNWGSKVEPVYTLTMSGVAGVFTSGELLTIGGETATVVTGGTSTITFNVPTGINFFNGDSVVGGSSGATGTVNTVTESFTGVDKSLLTEKQRFDAITTELKAVKGTRFWWEDADSSINDIVEALDAPSYDESITIVASGPGTNELVGPVVSGTLITLPLQTRLAGSPQQNYTVGKGALELYLNGQYLQKDGLNGWSEVGAPDSDSDQIQIDQQLEVTDVITFRIDAIGGPGSGGGGGGGGTPGGVTQDIQYNNAGGFAGNIKFKIDVADNALNLNGLKQSVLSSSLTILDNTAAPTPLFSFVAADYHHLVIEYSIVRDGDFRTGNFLVAHDGSVTGFNDQFVDTASVGVALTADISGTDVRILYTSTSTGFNGTLKFSVRRWS